MIKKRVEFHGHDTKTWLASLGPNSEELQDVERWIAQEEIYRLKVEVEETDGWHQRGSISPGGPLVVEDRVIPLDVRQANGDQLRIRLRPPAGFWALNSFAVVFDQADPVRVTSIKTDSV